jgi:MT0933-like antitoxin protein
MSFLDKAKDMLDKHDDKVDQLLEKAGDEIDKRTGGKYTGQIDRAVDEAQRRTGDGDTVR